MIETQRSNKTRQMERTVSYNNSLHNILLLSVLVLHVSALIKAIIG